MGCMRGECGEIQRYLLPLLFAMTFPQRRTQLNGRYATPLVIGAPLHLLWNIEI